jgi:glycosyltransferase involved in cell wall biosynthesis
MTPAPAPSPTHAHSPAPSPAAGPAAEPPRAEGWALCVSTCNRREMLCDCVRHALASSLAPTEIVIVDASDGWEQNRASVEATIAGIRPCPLNYVQAQRRSLTAQRNQGIALASADILFMIDDDAMLDPRAAARVMAHYRADARGRIVAISCCNTAPDRRYKRVAAVKQTNRAGSLVSGRGMMMQRGIDLALRHLLMIPAEQRFVGYDRPERRWKGDTDLPEGLVRVNFIVGFALTVRRSVALAEPFEDGLVGSAIGEDLDASYRFGRHGMLAFAPDAPIRHLEAAAGRTQRRAGTALAILNMAYFIRRNSTRQRRDFTRYTFWYARMLLAELPKDLAGGRWHLPQLRGALLAGRQLPALLRQPRAGPPEWYQKLQISLMAGADASHDQDTKDALTQGANPSDFPEAMP